MSNEAPMSEAARKILPLAQKWSRVWELPVSYVLAIIDVESSFRPSAKNPAAASQGGAWGLCQVTWTTAGTLIARLKSIDRLNMSNAKIEYVPPPWLGVLGKWKADEPTCLLDPDLNVMLGSYYLGRFASEFGRDIRKIAAAFHNGAGFLRAFLNDITQAFPGGLPPKARVYVQSVAQAQLRYADEDQTPALLAKNITKANDDPGKSPTGERKTTT